MSELNLIQAWFHHSKHVIRNIGQLSELNQTLSLHRSSTAHIILQSEIKPVYLFCSIQFILSLVSGMISLVVLGVVHNTCLCSLY